MKLPRSLDDLTGLRAARWSRESTTGQFDAFGPEAQREQQDRAIERYSLTDAGISWTVAHSGRTVGNTDQFRDMLARAGTDYDVLVVGYVSRFARDLRTAVNARHDLHAAGASILFADERILTSDEQAWDSWAREAVEAESYSRKLARRISEGYAAKRRRLGEPGGRPPFGFMRTGSPPRLQPEEGEAVLVRSCFAAAASSYPDRAIVRQIADVRLSLHRVRSILTNPIYIGQLRDGSPAAVHPIIDRATWDRVQALRAARNARGGIAVRNRVYALPMLSCAVCGRRLIGDTGRYRHPDPCHEFTAARRQSAYRNRLVRTPGHSYPASLYEDAVAFGLEEVSSHLGELLFTEAAATQAPVDELALRRIELSRSRALDRYRTHRSPATLEADMARLDQEEQRVRDSRPEVEWRDVLAELKDLPALWREASPERRRAIARQAFVSVAALGAREVTVTYWHGVQAVIGVGAKGFEPTLISLRTPWTLTEADSA